MSWQPYFKGLVTVKPCPIRAYPPVIVGAEKVLREAGGPVGRDESFWRTLQNG